MNLTPEIQQFNDQPLTMSSKEIADLVEKRHDHVKRTVDTLANKGVITFPQIEEKPSTGGRPSTEYRLEKRDTYVVVAQLSPEFTARLVDRWQELESRTTQTAALTGPQLMAAALIEADATMKAQAVQIESMKDDVAALEQIANADGSLCITDAAKALQMRPKDLFTWLGENGWIYRRPGAGHYLGYSSKTNSGLLEHKVTTVLRADGSERVTEQVRVTPRGLTKLAKLVSVQVQEVVA